MTQNTIKRANMIISVLNQKGGTGKTTIAVHLSYFFQSACAKSVLLVDSDPQASARDWSAANGGETLTVAGLDKGSLATDVLKFKDKFDVIIIDGAGKLTHQAASAIKVSDVILIPVQPSPYDVWATEDLVELIQARQLVVGAKLKAFFLLSAVTKNTLQFDLLKETLREMGLPYLKNYTTKRVVYADSAKEGQTIYHTSNLKAQEEFNALAFELVELLNNE